MLNAVLTHGSLFSGIGGFDLASEWMGWDNKFHCEWNEFAKQILKYYWANAASYGDITKTDFSIWRGRIDVLTGGFPCQPYSSAGKRLGKDDARHLWPQMLRAVREIMPSYIVGENVSGILSWNGGLVFDEVQSDLENEGYRILPIVLPACGVNAPHKRERVWFIAHAEGGGNHRTSIKSGSALERQDGQSSEQHTECSQIRDAAEAKYGDAYTKFGAWGRFPVAEPAICGGNDGIPPKLDGIAFQKWRSESLKAYGNAIVPQVAYQIFKAIQMHYDSHIS